MREEFRTGKGGVSKVVVEEKRLHEEDEDGVDHEEEEDEELRDEDSEAEESEGWTTSSPHTRDPPSFVTIRNAWQTAQNRTAWVSGSHLPAVAANSAVVGLSGVPAFHAAHATRSYLDQNRWTSRDFPLITCTTPSGERNLVFVSACAPLLCSPGTGERSFCLLSFFAFFLGRVAIGAEEGTDKPSGTRGGMGTSPSLTGRHPACTFAAMFAL